MVLHILEQKPSHEVKWSACRAQRQDCAEAQIWGRQKKPATLKVPESTVASIIYKWKKFGTTRTLPRAGRPAKLNNQGRRILVRKVIKNPVVTKPGFQRSCVKMGVTSRRTTITETYQWSGVYGRLARRKPLLSERHIKACLAFACLECLRCFIATSKQAFVCLSLRRGFRLATLVYNV